MRLIGPAPDGAKHDQGYGLTCDDGAIGADQRAAYRSQSHRGQRQGGAKQIGPVLGTAAWGSVLTVLGHTGADGGWFEVKGATHTGWISGDPMLSAAGRVPPLHVKHLRRPVSADLDPPALTLGGGGLHVEFRGGLDQRHGHHHGRRNWPEADGVRRGQQPDRRRLRRDC